jgi:hypothetical protein
MNQVNLSIKTYCFRTSALLLVGLLISGLPGNFLINIIHPQPPWVNIETYADNFHPIQLLPVWGGFIMLIGFIGFMTSMHYYAREEQRILSLLAVISSAIYGALISLNYILQLGVLQPNLQNRELDGMTFLVFANPHSITMSIEMLGYGFQGASTWLISSVFDNSKLGQWIKWLGIVNGVVSIAGAIIQGLNISLAIDNPLGKISFIGWNLLFTALCFLYVVYFSKKINANHLKSN